MLKFAAKGIHYWYPSKYSGLCIACGQVFYSARKEATICCSKCPKRRGTFGPSYKKGRTKSIHGYIILSGQYSHPKATGGSFNVPEHIIVMEKHLGRHLKPNETVHHKNGIRDDNRIDNLELWTSSHPYGQRVEDLLKFVIDNYPDELRKLL